MVYKKNLFETKNASHFLSGLHFLFQKGFFCKPFFEKILFVCVVALPSNTIFVRKTFLFTPFRRDTRKGAGKGYQVRKQLSPEGRS